MGGGGIGIIDIECFAWALWLRGYGSNGNTEKDLDIILEVLCDNKDLDLFNAST
jgi:hypothetical protein